MFYSLEKYHLFLQVDFFLLSHRNIVFLSLFYRSNMHRQAKKKKNPLIINSFFMIRKKISDLVIECTKTKTKYCGTLLKRSTCACGHFISIEIKWVYVHFFCTKKISLFGCLPWTKFKLIYKWNFFIIITMYYSWLSSSYLKDQNS